MWGCLRVLVFHHYYYCLIAFFTAIPTFVSAPKCRDTVATFVQTVGWYVRTSLDCACPVLEPIGIQWLHASEWPLMVQQLSHNLH